GNGNDLSGPMTFDATAGRLATLGLENVNPLATLPAWAPGVATSLTSATLVLENAPVALPSLTTATLTVVAGGDIAQAARAKLVVGDHAGFRTGAFAVQLPNPGNDFNVVSLGTSGLAPVALVASGGLVLDDWIVGPGTVAVVAHGAITEAGGGPGFR